MIPMPDGKVGSPVTVLTKSINATDLTIEFDTSVLGDDVPNLFTLGTELLFETVWYDAKTSSLVTLNSVAGRGFDGTTARSWPAGTPVARYVSDYDMRAMKENFAKVCMTQIEVTGLITDHQAVAKTVIWNSTPNTLTVKLPLDADTDTGDAVEIVQVSVGKFRITQNPGQKIVIGGQTSLANEFGYVECTAQNDCIALVKSPTVGEWVVVGFTGTFNVFTGTDTVQVSLIDVSNINDLSDVVITTPTDKQVIRYDNATGKFVNATILPADIGASATDHTHDYSATFAPVAKGVTNGDSHDHNGGDGAQIEYSTLGSIPSTFAPTAHATAHKTGGGDAIKLDELDAPTDNTNLNASTSYHGLAPKVITPGTGNRSVVSVSDNGTEYLCSALFSVLEPSALGSTAKVGTALTACRRDHVHPFPSAADVGAAPAVHAHEERLAMPTLGEYISGLDARSNIVNVACNTGLSTGVPDFQLAATPGRWFLSVDQRTRIRQNCSITALQFYVGPSNMPSSFWFMVWRKNAAGTWDYVGGENIISKMTAGKTNWITLTTPIAVKKGDYVGYGGIGTGMFLTPIQGDTVSTYYQNMSQPSGTYNWAAASPINKYLPMRCFGRAPVVVCIGNSITAGHPGNYSFIEATKTENVASDYTYRLEARTGVTVQNMGIGGQTSTQVLERFNSDCIYLHPKVAIIEVGLNDIQQGISQSTFISNVTAMFDACVADGIVPVFVALPWTGATDPQSTTLRTWYEAVRVLMDNYDEGTFVYGWRLLGSGANQWDIKTKYDCGDQIHYNADGYAALTTAILSARVGK
jgi:lysophospholipase L1-like esterase